MNRVFGHIEEFALVRQDESSTIVGWDYKEVGDGINATWNETIIYKKQVWNPGFNDIKYAVIADINKDTDQKILNGYQWIVKHGADEGKTVNVWLSQENQDNFKAKHDAAKDYPLLVKFPMKYKIGEDEEEKALYEEFQSLEELAEFYLGGLAYIEQCYNAGWEVKDNFDWSPYEALYPQPDEPIVEQ